MSNLALSNKDDYPAAAAKHLNDAAVLLNAGRFDAAGYLAGYVIECSLRTVVMVGRLATEAEETAIEQGWRNQAVNMKKELEASSGTMKRFLKKAKEEARRRGRDHDLDDLADAATDYKNVLTSYVAAYAPPIDKGRPPFGRTPKFTEIRYRAEGSITAEDARSWVQEAETLFTTTIGMMRRDGLIRL